MTACRQWVFVSLNLYMTTSSLCLCFLFLERHQSGAGPTHLSSALELLFQVLSKCPKIINENLLYFPIIHSGFISVPSLTSGPRTLQVPLEHPVSCSCYKGPGSQSSQGLGLSSSSERLHLSSLCPPGKQGGSVDRSFLQGPPAKGGHLQTGAGLLPKPGTKETLGIRKEILLSCRSPSNFY